MKKINIVVLLVFMLMLTLTACGNADDLAGGSELPVEDSVEEKVPLASAPAEEDISEEPDVSGADIEKPDASDEDSESSDTTDDDVRHTVEVLRVIDGDTIEIDYEGKKESLRMIGVDTPESVHPDQTKNIPYGQIASGFTKEQLEGKTVEIEFDTSHRDRYGRLLAYVYLDGELYNKRLLDEGHAVVATFPPNVRYVDMFTEAQSNARSAGKGLWGMPEEPAEAIAGIESSDSKQGEYIGNSNSMKFHFASCQWAKKISERNIVYFNTRDDAINSGQVPCKVCNP